MGFNHNRGKFPEGSLENDLGADRGAVDVEMKEGIERSVIEHYGQLDGGAGQGEGHLGKAARRASGRGLR